MILRKQCSIRILIKIYSSSTLNYSPGHESNYDSKQRPNTLLHQKNSVIQITGCLEDVLRCLFILKAESHTEIFHSLVHSLMASRTKARTQELYYGIHCIMPSKDLGHLPFLAGIWKGYRAARIPTTSLTRDVDVTSIGLIIPHLANSSKITFPIRLINGEKI